MINELNMVGTKIGLNMNMNKMEVMVNQRCATGTVEPIGTTLQVDFQVYLGRELNMMKA